jgi:hypothetical protein
MGERSRSTALLRGTGRQEQNGFDFAIVRVGGTRWRSLLRNYATSNKVAGSIAEVVIGFLSTDPILPAAL